MKASRFDEVVKERIDKINNTLVVKAKEYANDSNRLHNFDKAGSMGNQSREKALRGFLLKHIVSMDDIIESLDDNKLPTKQLLDEKIGDIINYYILLEACIVERLDNQGNTM
jgi:hypothetical protein